MVGIAFALVSVVLHSVACAGSVFQLADQSNHANRHRTLFVLDMEPVWLEDTGLPLHCLPSSKSAFNGKRLSRGRVSIGEMSVTAMFVPTSLCQCRILVTATDVGQLPRQ